MGTLLRRALLLVIAVILVLTWGDVGTDVYGQADPDPVTVTPDELAPPEPVGPQDKVPASSGAAAGGLSVPTGGKIAVIEIDGEIFYENQLDSLKRRTDRAIQDGADLVVFDLDTPGGALIIALDMSAYIRTLPVPTVAWVDNQALSAGILIGSACDELVMSAGSLTGDCAPIIPGQNLAPTERAKALSPLLAEFRANAADNYNGSTTSDYAIFHAMCVLGVEVYQVRHKITGEVRLVSQADYAVMVDGKSPVDAAGIGQNNNSSALTSPDEFESVGAPTVTVTDASESGQWELVKQIHNGSTLLTMNEVEALDAGLSRATVSSEAGLQKLYGAGSVERYKETWSESLVGFLVHPMVRAGLLLLGIVGIMLEYFSPGLIVPGAVGLAAIAVLIGAPFLVGLAQTWHLLLIVIGIALVIYEMFTMTTFGVLAVLGLLMLIAGLVLSGVQTASNGLPAEGSARQVMITSLSFVGAIILTIPVLFVMTKYFGSLPLLNKLVLTESQPTMVAAAGGGAAVPHQRVSGDEVVGGGSIKPGMTGVVTRTGLRPAGNIEIDDQLIDVTSTGGFVEAGTTVRVVEVHGSMIMVEPVEDDE
ncbi:MAG: NfeD family protein [Planctomycetota bacterium]